MFANGDYAVFVRSARFRVWMDDSLRLYRLQSYWCSVGDSTEDITPPGTGSKLDYRVPTAGKMVMPKVAALKPSRGEIS